MTKLLSEKTHIQNTSIDLRLCMNSMRAVNHQPGYRPGDSPSPVLHHNSVVATGVGSRRPLSQRPSALGGRCRNGRRLSAAVLATAVGSRRPLSQQPSTLGGRCRNDRRLSAAVVATTVGPRRPLRQRPFAVDSSSRNGRWLSAAIVINIDGRYYNGCRLSALDLAIATLSNISRNGRRLSAPYS